MTKYVPLALLATFATLLVVPHQVFAAEANQQVRDSASGVAASSALAATAGKMLYGPDGNRIASIYRVAANGDAQIILNGRLLTVPAATLSTASGKVATSLTKTEINHR